MKRRHFIKNAGLAAASFNLMKKAESSERKDPHFLLLIVNESGTDDSYWVDARPNDMTDKGLIQNHFFAQNDLSTDRILWEDNKGGKTLVTSAMQPLANLRDHFSIINGVHMAAGFDGHDQSLNYLLTGNPFGGEYFVPTLTRELRGYPLDYIGNDRSFGFAGLNNLGGGLDISPSTAKRLADSLKQIDMRVNVPKALEFARMRSTQISKGSGLLSKGSGNLAAGLRGMADLAERVKSVNLEEKNNNRNLIDVLPMFIEFFKSGVTPVAVYKASGDFDAHDLDLAREQPKHFQNLAQELADTISLFLATEMPGFPGRSLLDFTTIIATSEFSRTMRQQNKPISESGTDHNSLSNSFIIAGKGVAKGRIIGESDFATADETISMAHKQKENVVKSVNQVMGRPFDFASQKTLRVLPEEYKSNQYLKASNIVNSVFKMFGVTEEKWFKADRNGAVDKPLTGIIG